MTDFEISELTIPASIDAPDWPDFAEMVDVRNAIEADTSGFDHVGFVASEILPHWQDPHDPKRLFVARVDGRIVARAIYQFGTEPGDPVASISAEVHPGHRRTGIGTALFNRLASLAAADGRTVLQASFDTRADLDGPTIPSPTGFGSVPANDPGVRFAIARGYRLVQVVRESRLALPADETRLRDLLRDATDAAGSDYRILRWTDRTPDRWIADLAVLHTRMRTDAPTAELDVDEPDWTDERVRTQDALREASPRTVLVNAIEHIPSGTLVGFSELNVPPDTSRAVAQVDTLVLSDHRGHRLGMLLKLDNLQRLTELHPGHPSINTYNAEENRHMLDVNEAIGFVPVSYTGAWKKTIGI